MNRKQQRAAAAIGDIAIIRTHQGTVTRLPITAGNGAYITTCDGTLYHRGSGMESRTHRQMNVSQIIGIDFQKSSPKKETIQ